MNSPADQLIKDFTAAIKRLAEKPIENFDQVNAELRNELYPSMVALAEQVSDVDGVIQEIVEQQDSYITDELAAAIFAAFAVGLALAEEVEKLSLDDLSKRKMSELVEALRESTQQATIGVTEATGGNDESDDEEGDQDG